MVPLAPRKALHGKDGKGVTSLSLFLNGLATAQVVWVYLLHIPGAVNLTAFENGTERTPFQYRLLLSFPLRWSHCSTHMAQAVTFLEGFNGWLPAHLRPEGLLQFLVDGVCLATTGLFARRLYQATSRTQLITPFIYPLTLALVAFTYTLLTTHALRFVYDFPSLAFFAIGTCLIYRRRHAWFVLLFAIATVNRETTLLLLPLYAVTQCIPLRHSTTTSLSPDWSRLYAPRTMQVASPLAVAWIAWHLYVVHRFAGNASAAGPRVVLNFGLLLCPLSWPQVATACGFLCPIIFACRNRIQDATLRLWVWLLPAWFGFMLVFGLLIEPRVFGELIPLVACTAGLIAEETILRKSTIAACADQSPT